MFYCVRNGRKKGIFSTWQEAEESVKCFKGAEFKKVKTMEEAKVYMEGGIVKSGFVYAEKESKKIFDSWEECRDYVSGRSGVQYKKFKSMDEALAWINTSSKDVDSTNELLDLDESIPSFYIDGSHRDGTIGFGVVEKVGDIITCYSGQTDGGMGNISGELSALMFSLHLIKRLGIKEANIIYDYEGIYKWLSGEYRAQTLESKSYKKFAKNFTKENDLKLYYYKCKSHSGNKYNNMADATAKQALIDAKFYPQDMLTDIELGF